MSFAKRLTLTILITAWTTTLIIAWIALCRWMEIPAGATPAGIFLVFAMTALPIGVFSSIRPKP